VRCNVVVALSSTTIVAVTIAAITTSTSLPTIVALATLIFASLLLLAKVVRRGIGDQTGIAAQARSDLKIGRVPCLLITQEFRCIRSVLTLWALTTTS
jgi:hypothetical protein